jgi:hypothetical protein
MPLDERQVNSMAARKRFNYWYDDFIQREGRAPQWRDIKAAIGIKEARPTVRAKRPVQQLKPKMPLLADVLNHVNLLSVVGNCNVISRQVGAEIAYNFISRHIGH